MIMPFQGQERVERQCSIVPETLCGNEPAFYKPQTLTDSAVPMEREGGTRETLVSRSVPSFTRGWNAGTMNGIKTLSRITSASSILNILRHIGVIQLV